MQGSIVKLTILPPLKGVLHSPVTMMTKTVTWKGNEKEAIDGLGKSSINDFSESYVIDVHLEAEYT